ncbi:MAG: TraB/GumN family protein [Proteobacteria bacterium]|nr:TraB/GumN family protein [Pseudomonadota bacterium]
MAYRSRIFRPLFLLLVLAAAVVGVAPPALAGGPPLWRAEAGPTTFHFLGTFHLLTPEVEWINPEILAAFDASDKMVLELSPEQQSPGLFAFLIAQKGIYKDGKTLKDEIGEEEYLRLVGQASELGFPESMLRNFKPWYAAVAMTVQFSQVHGFDPEYGVESVLSQEARDVGKPIIGLETADEQLSALADLPMDIQVRMLSETLDELASLPDIWGAMIVAWAGGDIETLEELMFQFLNTEPQVYEQLITVRNRNWVGRINSLASKPGSYLIAVGVAHLIGPDSLLTMLAAEGYQIERIEAQEELSEEPEQEPEEEPEEKTG